ncbi:23S rRNA (adenine(2503)-C(2))-methyltransferase RlmN [Oleiphilus sp. HI0071]|uniref:23S rRNA (adenine(2503)-C(2))-methyltransferase RlmN n=1 Tax=unclassified Oleiphilus TaxID=2631174 RepID=UPI0007C23D4B|nr:MULTISPECIES: 23S rRNA (adenine(2503)-C(2))-methyltransferase RlmN [unclassified Oleiphilus]KZY74868.1 23S rRNA (adenine(2503)-C(2))-methyltransferase RlmN [Oleiphilus sp. HI0065]KZY82050.1 23S rRNA (adenine(2503)-C(2))-methyltransferase RlmN [Oleiphilus sp. HI0071]KZY91180.1 23S rRNA (adenine(2503)-C(2))-methyltransferase RlmN [Oleiphilus sp. HI0073]KZZ42203.1 23S rRNA (adenine(2503)-C(2))-methyltransferase RlmN [Oleiphilus sp. HI0118]KZZ60351.1 23S rRNA (adenine(2503)-C(2))-methyltransfer
MTDNAPKQRTNLLGMPRKKMEAFFAEMGEKPFRAKQIMQWIHQYGVSDFDEMTNISKSLRTKLKEICEITAPEVIYHHISSDGTRKWVMKMPGGSSIETVLIPEGNRGTLCVSSQIGCALDCSFCSTGKQGFNRNLSAEEIVGQIFNAIGSFEGIDRSKDRPVTNVVFMGMGEPLLNFENVMDAVDLMMDDYAYSISKRRLTISTAGVVPAIERMIGVTDASIAISLHAPNDKLRNELVPVNKKYPIDVLLTSVRKYLSGLPDKRKATIEYTLLAGVNDRREHATQLIKILEGLPCKVNLIPFNPFPNSGYKKPSNNEVRCFQDWLTEGGLITTVRTTRGDDIDAACGQLVGKVEDRTRRSERYINLQQVSG